MKDYDLEKIEEVLKMNEKKIKQISINAKQFASTLNEAEINQIWYEYIKKVVERFQK